MKSLKTAIFMALALTLTSAASAKQPASDSAWIRVAGNVDLIPGHESDGTTFNSYNQPSVNSSGFVVFRARSRGPNPVSGIYARAMRGRAGPLLLVADRDTEVPQPNNTEYPNNSGDLATFNEFPAFPRISAKARIIATRGNSQPVWTYDIGDGETRVGTSGIFTQSGGGALQSAMTQLGFLLAFADMEVPGAAPGTRFDQFPGAPSPTDDGLIVFKGNYTEGDDGKTGVFFRDFSDDPTDGTATRLIAATGTLVGGCTLGSTAPPSAAGDQMVFVGYDNEDEPGCGGVYLAPLQPYAEPIVVAQLGDPVPGGNGETLTRFGEALSFDGRYISFWGAWGEEVVDLVLSCPEEGNRDRRCYCLAHDDDKAVQVPARQGFFLHDTRTGLTTRLASTGAGWDDFLYWNYSGAPPAADASCPLPPGGDGGGSHGSGERPKWRASAFSAVAGKGRTARVAFKARAGEVVGGAYPAPLDGVYMAHLRGARAESVTTVVDTNTPATDVDPGAPSDLLITEIGLERDGLRGNWLVLSLGATADEEVEQDETESLAGVYITRVPGTL